MSYAIAIIFALSAGVVMLVIEARAQSRRADEAEAHAFSSTRRHIAAMLTVTEQLRTERDKRLVAEEGARVAWSQSKLVQRQSAAGIEAARMALDFSVEEQRRLKAELSSLRRTMPTTDPKKNWPPA